MSTSRIEVTRRFGLSAQLTVEVSESSETNFFELRDAGTTARGLFVATSKSLPPRTVVDLIIGLPNGSIALRGVVTFRVKGDRFEGIAIEFESLPSACEELIDEFERIRPPIHFRP